MRGTAALVESGTEQASSNRAGPHSLPEGHVQYHQPTQHRGPKYLCSEGNVLQAKPGGASASEDVQKA